MPVDQKYDVMIRVGFATIEQKVDGLAQMGILDAALPWLEAMHPGKFVAVAGGQLFVADTPEEAEDAAMLGQPGRQFVLAPLAPAHFGFL